MCVDRGGVEHWVWLSCQVYLGRSQAMQQLWDAADFVRKLRKRLRFGNLSRANLKLLRFELTGDSAECDWIARAADPWDRDLENILARRNASIQALEDSLAVRELLFHAVPSICEARLQVHRQINRGDTELIIEGVVSRDEPPDRNIRSLAMRATLCGLHFRLDDGVLLAMQPETSVAG
jgi:hypothetical protein